MARPTPGSAGAVPPSSDGTPVSFRKNVNRAKTKRWIEARQYSYDGDDWGDDEYGEYDTSPPPVSQPPSLAQANGGASGLSSGHASRPSLLSADRSRSADHVTAVDSSAPRNDRFYSTDGKDVKAPQAASQPKVVPFIRPADIYKRMQQAGTDSRGQSLDLGRPNKAVGQSHPIPASNTSSLPIHGSVADGGNRAIPQTLDPVIRAKPGDEEESRSSDFKTGDTAAVGLPEIKRLSNLDIGAFSQPASSAPDTTSTDPQSPAPLRHNNSFGFQSAVHQAFDVPETPDSTADTVSRTNSDSTSVVSPIITRRTVSDQKTPTIVEEAGESVSTPAETPRSVPFKPGHRRDVSLPSPDNSPSRKPEISEGGQYPRPASAEMSSTDSPQDYFQLNSSTVETPGSSRQPPSHGDEIPAPLRPVSTSMAQQSDSKGSIPVIIPSMSTDNSPHDTENDRLRKEIIRSLSRENSPSDGAEGFQPETAHGDGVNTNQGEIYRNDEAGHSAAELSKPEARPQSSGPPNTVDELPSGGPQSAPAPATEQPRPRLTRRFSWESSSSEELPPAGDFQPAPLQTPAFDSEPPRTSDGGDQLGLEPAANDLGNVGGLDPIGRESIEKPTFSVIPPSAADENNTSDWHLPEVFNSQAVQNAPPSEHDGLPAQPLLPVSAPPPSAEPVLLGFRDILGIKSSGERVRAFNRTRDQFAAIDTGLNHWIRVTVNAHPEHMDVVGRAPKVSDSATKPSVSKGKFPKLPSLGNLAPTGSPAALHVRRPSTGMMNRQQVEQRGKDLLHTAGVLGGRAGGAAKGLLAKGKHKLNRGGADKGNQSSRRSVHLLEDPTATDLQGPSSRKQRRSFSFGSVFSFTPVGIEDTSRDPASKHKRIASEGPGSRWLHTRSINNASIDDVNAQKAEWHATSQVPATKSEALSAALNERPLPSPLLDAIPSKTGQKKSGDIRSFEEELVAALRLDDVRLHENACANRFSPSRSLAQASNATLSGSPSHMSDASVVVASKAVKPDQVRVVDNRLPKDRGEKPMPAAGTHGEEGTKEMDSGWAPLFHDHPGEALASSTLPRPVHLAREPRTSGSQAGSYGRSTSSDLGGDPDDPNRECPSVSSLATQDASPLPAFQEPQLGHRHDYSKVSLLSEQGAPTLTSNRATDNLRRPANDSLTSEWKPSCLRNGIENPANTGSSSGSLGHLASDNLRNPDNMRANATADGNKTSLFAARSSTENHAQKGQTAMDKLKNISKLRRISLGAADGEIKNAMNRLSGLFGRSGTLEKDKSEVSPSFESFGGRLCFSATDNPNFGNRFGVYDTAVNNPSIKGGPPPGRFYRDPGRDLAEEVSEKIVPSAPFHSHVTPPGQNPLGVHRRPALRRASLPVQSTAPSRNPDPPRKFSAAGPYIQSWDQKSLPPSPDELSSDSPHNPGTPPSQLAPGDEGEARRVINTGTMDTTDQKSVIQRKPTASKALPLTPEKLGRPLQAEPLTPAPNPENKTHGHSDEGRVVTETPSPVELPVRRDDTSEEIVMTPTSYPGQEWRPAGF